MLCYRESWLEAITSVSESLEESGSEALDGLKELNWKRKKAVIFYFSLRIFVTLIKYLFTGPNYSLFLMGLENIY